MSDDIGWRFPPTNGGRIDGFNDPGIAHFTGAPLASLAREIIQNSLDARLAPDEPVHVSFEMIYLHPGTVGQDDLAIAIDASRQMAGDDPLASGALTAAAESIRLNVIPCLRVSDRNTTGLRGDQWRALVKMQGVSQKPEMEGAGGSHGIGKYAPFAVSTLRTVFYWTCFLEDGKEREKFQGKSVLMSHTNAEGEETQGTGFFGVKKNCLELTREIPQSFRVLDQHQRPVQGTSLAIMGFRETDDWRRRVAASTIGNFFYAIGTGRLTVIVEPDESNELMEIDRGSLEQWFQHLTENADSDDPENISDDPLREAQIFWKLSRDEPVTEKQDSELGHCRLWIHTAEGMPSKVAFVRRTGMLVTTQQPGLMRFHGHREFAALCVFEDPAGNELLRRMENPKHDQFEPDRLPKDERSRGRSALKRITAWIRSEIRKQAGPPEGGRRTVLSELAVYLPDYQPEEPFDDVGHDGSESSGEPGFGERVTLTLKPVRRPAPPIAPVDDRSDGDGDGDGDNAGAEGGAGTDSGSDEGGNGGEGEGDGQGGTGTRGGGSRQRGIPISGVRILPIVDRENCYQLSFMADADGIVRLAFEEAGDSSTVPRDDIRAVAEDAPLDRVRVAKGQRTVVEITSDGSIKGRAWRLSAVEAGAVPGDTQ